jgi:hypothetical protein
VVTIAANYATQQYCVQLASGAGLTVPAGATRDTVTDATTIATWSADWTATAPTAATVGPLLAAWLAVYPRGTVS